VKRPKGQEGDLSEDCGPANVRKGKKTVRRKSGWWIAEKEASRGGPELSQLFWGGRKKKVPKETSHFTRGEKANLQ